MKLAFSATSSLTVGLALWLGLWRAPTVELLLSDDRQIFQRSPIIVLATIDVVIDTGEEADFRVGTVLLQARRFEVEFKVEERFRGQIKSNRGVMSAWQFAGDVPPRQALAKWAPGYRAVLFLHEVGSGTQAKVIEPIVQVLESSWFVQTKRPISNDVNCSWKRRLDELLLEPDDQSATFASAVALSLRRVGILGGRDAAIEGAQRLIQSQPNEVGIQACRALILEWEGRRDCVAVLRASPKLSPLLKKDLDSLEDTLKLIRVKNPLL